MLMTKGIKEIVIPSSLIYVNIDYRVFEFRIFVLSSPVQVFDFHVWKIDFHVCKNKVCFFRSLVVILSLLWYWCSWLVKFNGNRKFLVLNIYFFCWSGYSVLLLCAELVLKDLCVVNSNIWLKNFILILIDWYNYWSKVGQKFALWSKFNNTSSPPRK